MARRIRRPGGGPQLRAEVLAELREQLGHMVEAVPWIAEMLAAIERGDEVELNRWDLPDSCPHRHVGRPGDRVVLRADNTVAEVG